MPPPPHAAPSSSCPPLPLRYDVGDHVMCNLGPDGWSLGRIVARHYREDHWPAERVAPYQVGLEGDHSLIYVPEDHTGFCRGATREDFNIVRRLDALAPLPVGLRGGGSEVDAETGTSVGVLLSCCGQPGSPASDDVSGYRDGRCHGCHRCPCCWTSCELYSEHYRGAARNGLKITRHAADLGTVRVGASVHRPPNSPPASASASATRVRRGFKQSPTLARLPPGVTFSDNGALGGEVRFDPHRPASYTVEFVAVSTAEWDTPSIGLVRLEITFVVEANVPPAGFDDRAFMREQQAARSSADRFLRDLCSVWEGWERRELGNRETIDRMGAHLHGLRELLMRHPRLGGGWWWAQLGGFHMNVHKLLENTLFECELYLGHAMTFGDAKVRRIAEQNLEGCYQKRLLETARFMWMDGVAQMMRGSWPVAAETLRLAADKKDGWGWGVNNGDIWIAEAAARLVLGAELAMRGAIGDAPRQLAEVAQLLERGAARAAEGGLEGHPWASENIAALYEYHGLRENGADVAAWVDALKKRTVFWCAQVLGGAAPFPPKPRPRLQEAAALRLQLPDHNE